MAVRLGNFNPRSPCGERPFSSLTGKGTFLFQSTLPLRRATIALRGGGDAHLFQSTLPLRRATFASAHEEPELEISIHAPLAESDEAPCLNQAVDDHFNPRSPCGERPRYSTLPLEEFSFQSTLPLRRATRRLTVFLHLQFISIHAPLAESDRSAGSASDGVRDFNPRSPCGERPSW